MKRSEVKHSEISCSEVNCSEVLEQLSEYHDAELTTEARAVVSSHLAKCEDCAARLAEYKSFTKAFARLTRPTVPAAVWAGIARRLNHQSVSPSSRNSGGKKSSSRMWSAVRHGALAASILLAVGLGFWLTQEPGGSSSHHAEFAATMDQYLTTLARNPDEAERYLLSKYNGETVDAKDAIRLVGYRPAVASGVPEKYTLVSTSVMKMPCCTCVKAVCKRRDGSTLVLFEHDDAETQWFGKRTSSKATCGDKECCLVDLDESIAATWKHGSRWVTAVGARSTAEVGELVTWSESHSDSGSLPL